MVKKNTTGIDCACVIHSTGYDWIYVQNLRNMIQRNINGDVRMHVFTEASRKVPDSMIKHELVEWPTLAGPKKSWWYKMQMFNPEHFRGNLLYMDLDVVVAGDLNWITECSTDHLWAIRDFKYLQHNGQYNGINSSVMWWNTDRFSWLWDEFAKIGPREAARRWHGDQEFITAQVDNVRRRHFPDRHFQSYRWQCLDGGYDFQRRQHRTPGRGVAIAPETSVVVFHGNPKPHQVHDPAVVKLWC